jgi:hypothetical protein
VGLHGCKGCVLLTLLSMIWDLLFLCAVTRPFYLVLNRVGFFWGCLKEGSVVRGEVVFMSIWSRIFFEPILL